MEEIKKITELLAPLEPSISKIRNFDFTAISNYGLCCRSSICKCFDFCNTSANSSESSAFFLQPSLRGICEDTILMSFLETLPTNLANSLVNAKMNDSVQRSVDAQSVFFQKQRTFQQVVGSKPGTKLSFGKKPLDECWEEAGFPKNIAKKRGPSVKMIAEKIAMGSLYDYFYHMTSKTVHFDPHHLIRMGWGKGDKCSTSHTHFSSYFHSCCAIYGVVLLCLQIERISVTEAHDLRNSRPFLDLRTYIRGLSRWPEIVTWEELNLNPPGFSPISFLQQQGKMGGEGSEQLSILD